MDKHETRSCLCLQIFFQGSSTQRYHYRFYEIFTGVEVYWLLEKKKKETKKMLSSIIISTSIRKETLFSGIKDLKIRDYNLEGILRSLQVVRWNLSLFFLSFNAHNNIFFCTFQMRQIFYAEVMMKLLAWLEKKGLWMKYFSF